jgi:hypothetical protein
VTAADFLAICQRASAVVSKISKVDVAEAQSLPAASVNLASAKAARRPIDRMRPSALTSPLLSVRGRCYEIFSSNVV